MRQGELYPFFSAMFQPGSDDGFYGNRFKRGHAARRIPASVLLGRRSLMTPVWESHSTVDIHGGGEEAVQKVEHLLAGPGASGR